jgi:hypothetical protein
VPLRRRSSAITNHSPLLGLRQTVAHFDETFALTENPQKLDENQYQHCQKVDGQEEQCDFYGSSRFDARHNFTQ